VEAGNRRAAEAGLSQLKFQEGDARKLEAVDDHSFDLTLSVSGAMFAPKPFDVAKEMVRATKPGGRIVMATGSPTIRPSCRSSSRLARRSRLRLRKDSSVP